MIAQIIQDQRGSAPNDVSVTVAELQRIADSSGPGQPPRRSIGRLRIMFVVGSSWPWRAIESDRASPHRRMMCFREFEQVQRVLLERLDWQRVDEEFVAEHLATPGSLPGITADWVPSHLFDAMFESYRLGTREERYQTKPDRIVNLAHRLGARRSALGGLEREALCRCSRWTEDALDRPRVQPSAPGVVDVDR